MLLDTAIVRDVTPIILDYYLPDIDGFNAFKTTFQQEITFLERLHTQHSNHLKKNQASFSAHVLPLLCDSVIWLYQIDDFLKAGHTPPTVMLQDMADTMARQGKTACPTAWQKHIVDGIQTLHQQVHAQRLKAKGAFFFMAGVFLIHLIAFCAMLAMAEALAASFSFLLIFGIMDLSVRSIGLMIAYCFRGGHNDLIILTYCNYIWARSQKRKTAYGNFWHACRFYYFFIRVIRLH